MAGGGGGGGGAATGSICGGAEVSARAVGYSRADFGDGLFGLEEPMATDHRGPKNVLTEVHKGSAGRLKCYGGREMSLLIVSV
ncbi:hypothetical protein ZWY2020_039896 [Hordeum vulgare]|nr:hypothetical protein ZWY2020_039896 [Hordeum vulgare]